METCRRDIPKGAIVVVCVCPLRHGLEKVCSEIRAWGCVHLDYSVRYLVNAPTEGGRPCLKCTHLYMLEQLARNSQSWYACRGGPFAISVPVLVRAMAKRGHSWYSCM